MLRATQENPWRAPDGRSNIIREELWECHLAAVWSMGEGGTPVRDVIIQQPVRPSPKQTVGTKRRTWV